MLYINSIVISYCRYCLQVISKHGRFDEIILKHFKIIFSCLISSIAAMFFITFLEFFFAK